MREDSEICENTPSEVPKNAGKSFIVLLVKDYFGSI